MWRVIATVLSLAVLLSACGTSEIKPSGAEQSIIELVSSKTGIKPGNVTCPSGVEAKVGNTFDCHFTGPHGTKYTAHMKITKVHGSSVDFFISTSLT